MSDPFIGEIKIWAFDWVPRGWALCNGAILQVNQNQALFALLGNSFGGDGKTTFALPDLRGRVPVALGSSAADTKVTYSLGNAGGAETTVLAAATLPSHQHSLNAAALPGAQAIPADGVLSNATSVSPGSSTDFSLYQPQAGWTANTQLNAGSLTTTGSGTPISNMQGSAVVNFAICTSGVFPQQG